MRNKTPDSLYKLPGVSLQLLCTTVMDEGRIVGDGDTGEILADEKFLSENLGGNVRH